MAQNKRWRIGLISDLHGNVIALRSALAALDAIGFDQLICLGDVAIFGPSPNETIATLRDLACPVVLGNTDDWALDPHPYPYRNEETPIYNDIELWGAQQLNADERAFLRTFVPSLTLEVGKTKVLCYHGSPRSYDEEILATTTDSELATVFAGHDAAIAIGGHTHVQMVRRYANMIIANPGSVGAPFALRRDTNRVYFPAWAEFGLLELSESAQGPTLQFQINRVPIDLDALADTVNASDLPHPEWYLSHWSNH